MRIEGCDLVDLGQSKLHFQRQSGKMRGREMAVAILNEMQILNEQIAPPFALAEQRTDFRKRLRIDLAAFWRARPPAPRRRRRLARRPWPVPRETAGPDQPSSVTVSSHHKRSPPWSCSW